MSIRFAPGAAGNLVVLLWSLMLNGRVSSLNRRAKGLGKPVEDPADGSSGQYAPDGAENQSEHE